MTEDVDAGDSWGDDPDERPVPLIQLPGPTRSKKESAPNESALRKALAAREHSIVAPPPPDGGSWDDPAHWDHLSIDESSEADLESSLPVSSREGPAAPPPVARRKEQPSRRSTPERTNKGRSSVPEGEFTTEAMLRLRSMPPSRGLRKAVYALTGGLVNLGPGPDERRERERIVRVRARLDGTKRIAIISRKGGVGKTTSTVMLGHTFSAWRGDRVVALDGNPDAGSLGYRVRRETDRTVSDLLAEKHRITKYSDMRRYTSQAPTRLEVVASDDDPRIATAIGESEYREAIELLEHHYNLILLDTGTGILDSATRGILDMADQIIVVMAPSLDSARASSLTLDWLDQHGYRKLVENSVAVINAVRPGGLVEIKRIEKHFGARSRALIRIPWDKHLEAGAETSLNALDVKTREAYLDLAAAVADGFETVDLR